MRGNDYYHLLNTSVRNSKHLLRPNHLSQEYGAPTHIRNRGEPVKGAQGGITGYREAVGGEVYIELKLGMIKCNVPNTYTRVHGEGE